MATMDTLLHESRTGSNVTADDQAINCRSVHLPIGLALVGTITGASACALPITITDWTSATVVEMRALKSFSGHVGPPTLAIASPASAPTVRELKDRSGLTWSQLADAMAVKPRTLHLWRRGGGISAGHEERLRELHTLIDNLDLGASADVRGELVEPTSGGSLLAHLRSGASPRGLVVLAPWRLRARADLVRNIDARLGGGAVDEDYVFLLYLPDEQVRQFAERGETLLANPETTRRSWELEIESQFQRMDQPTVAVEAAPTEVADDSAADLVRLFDPLDLGIPLGVGAIAGRGQTQPD
jgi:hypothetical protein